MSEFLNSKTAVGLYAKLAFESKGNGLVFNEAWHDTLEANGVTVTQDVNEDDIIPKKIIGAIETAVLQDKVFAQFKPIFNAEAGSIVIEATENADGAWGHKLNSDKKMQNSVLETRDLFPKAIYKLQRLDHMTFLKGGALVEWVLTELPKYVLQRISQAILVGGVKNEDGTDFNAIRPIIGDSLTDVVDLPANFTGEQFKEALITSLATVEDDNPTIFVSPNAWAKLALSGDAWSVAMFTGVLDLGGTLIRTSRLPDDAPFLIIDPEAYLLLFSGSGIETLSDFAIMQNSQIIESRAYVAGTLRAPNRAVVAKVAGGASAPASAPAQG